MPMSQRVHLPRGSVAALVLVTCLVAGAAGARTAQEPPSPRAAGGKPAELPLAPERSVDFTTNEGTWISLDVTPDGKTIVFELLGDLYTLPIEGGEAVPLTSGMAFDSQPRVSPDGTRVAFLSDRDGAENLWVMALDGKEPKKLSADDTAEFASPCWLPDSQYVVVSRSSWGLRTYELWMYHVLGGSGVQVTKAKAKPDLPPDQRHNAIGAAASPDGRYLYYARKTGGFAYNVRFPLWQIARRDLRTGDEDVITRAAGSAFRPLVSPDGTHLLYGTRDETQTALRVRNLATGDDSLVRFPVQRDDQESRFTRDLLPGYAFLPGGREIVVSFGGRLHRLDLASGSSREIPFSAKVSQQLGPRLHFPLRVDEGPVRTRLIQDPALSPDGRRLVFSALTHLYVMDLPAGTPRRLTTGDAREFHPAWSPDGRWLAYVTWTADGGHLWKVVADGSQPPAQLTTAPALYADPAFSPDGTRVVVLRGSRFMRTHTENEFGGLNVPLDVVWLPADGGTVSLVAPARGLGKPHFAAGEPDRIYLYGVGLYQDGGGQGLISMRYDGTDRRTHLKVTGQGLYANEKPVGASDARVSPDGRWVLAHVQNQLYVLALPRPGGDAPEVDVNKPLVPVKKLTDIGADYFGWADGGKTITWALGATFFRLSLAAVTFDAPKPDEQKADAAGAAPGTIEPAGDPLPVEELDVVVERPRAVPKGSVVLRGARLVTMKGDEVIDRGDIVVTDNRIVAVGRSGRVPVPSGATVIDASGTTILPGFVDTHAHWSEVRKGGVLDVQNWSFLANLAYGVTTGLDVQTMTNDMFAYQDLVDTGDLLGPRAYSTGPGIFSDHNFKTVAQARRVLERYKRFYRTRHLKSYIVGNRKQRQLVVEAAKALEMMPTTEGGLDLKLDLTHAIDGFTGNEHTLPIVPLFKDVAELYARSGINYTPALLVLYGGPAAEDHFYTTTEVHDDPKLSRFVPHEIVDIRARRRDWFRGDEHNFSEAAEQAGKIIRAGGRVGIGAHGQLQGLGYHWEMWALASGGVTPMEVLRAATLHGAEMLGFADDLGSLEPGKLADLVVLDRNPIVDIRNTNSVRYVMKNGELFEGDSLTRVWPSRQPLPRMWWQRDEDLAAPPARR